MTSINFPNMFSGARTLLVKDSAATLQNIVLLLDSCKGELFGDPYFGAKLKTYIYQQNNIILRDVIIDDILVCLQTFIPQIGIERNDIELELQNETIFATISCINRIDGTTDLYRIKLIED